MMEGTRIVTELLHTRRMLNELQTTIPIGLPSTRKSIQTIDSLSRRVGGRPTPHNKCWMQNSWKRKPGVGNQMLQCLSEEDEPLLRLRNSKAVWWCTQDSDASHPPSIILSLHSQCVFSTPNPTILKEVIEISEAPYSCGKSTNVTFAHDFLRDFNQGHLLESLLWERVATWLALASEANVLAWNSRIPSR